MTSRITASFRRKFEHLPQSVQNQARQAFRLWKTDPYHSSLQFKSVHPTEPFFSARVGQQWRVVALKDGDTVDWFWIGSHADYDTLLRQI